MSFLQEQVLSPKNLFRLWIVDASAVCILKVECIDGQSVDLLCLEGCSFSSACDTGATFLEFDALLDQKLFTMPRSPSPVGDSIELALLFRRELCVPESSFTVELLHTLRSWARARHVYGTRFG